LVKSEEHAISSDPAAIVVLPVAHAVVVVVEIGPFVVSTGELVATPVNDEAKQERPPPVDADSVTVIVVPLARPEGACAEMMATCDEPPPVPCLSIVQVRPPPDTEVTVCGLTQVTVSTMKLLEAAAADVVIAIVLPAVSAANSPRFAWSTAIATMPPYGKVSSAEARSVERVRPRESRDSCANVVRPSLKPKYRPPWSVTFGQLEKSAAHVP